MNVRPLSEPARELIDAVQQGLSHDGLADCLLLLSRMVSPDLDTQPYRARLAEYARRLSEAVADEDDDMTRIQCINDLLYREEGFRGNREEYYDPRNSLLNEVLDRRLGLPITLSVLYIELGRRIGLRLSGVGFPGHFLVRLDTGVAGQFRIIDPFSQGRLLTASSLRKRLEELRGDVIRDPRRLTDPALPQAVVLRALRNLRGAYVRRRDLLRALVISDVMLELNPVDPTEWLSRGRILEDMDCAVEACEDYRRTLALAPDADPEGQLEQRMRRLGSGATRLH